MWEDTYEPTEAERHTQDWVNELRETEERDVEPSAEVSASARLRPEHTLTWAVAELSRAACETHVDVCYRDECELIEHVRNVVALNQESWAPGAAIFQDHGDELSVAYLVVLRADVDELNHVLCAVSSHHIVQAFDGGVVCERCGVPEHEIN